ncbi:MAG: glycosyltransferase [Methylobacteriaceae bacterium]|nr:glycosyltransferase [Methylobacteriaceae bacterium]
MPHSYAYAYPLPAHPLAGRTILQIVPELDSGGAERAAIDIAEALAGAGARALVATEGGRLISELQAKGGIAIRFPAATKNPFAMAANVSRLTHLLRAERVDLMHARSRAPAWVALAAARRARVPLVTTFHGIYSGRSPIKLNYNSVMVRGAVTIANSAFTAEHIAKTYPQASERIAVIYRGVDFRRFSPGAVDPMRVRRLRDAWKIAPHEQIVLMPARMSERKGHRVLIEAAALLKAQREQGFAVVLAGGGGKGGTYARDVDKLIAKAGLTEMVRRVGHCDDMPAAYLAASVVAVPSTEPESFGRVAVEAQAMATPVVVSELGGLRETSLVSPNVPPGRRTGWHVPPGDAAALAAALGEALALGAASRDALGSRARAFVQANFSLSRMCAETLTIYERLLDLASI